MAIIPAALDALPLDTFEAGEVLIHENSEMGALLFLVHGTVEVSKQGQLITRVREHGAMFGEMSVLLKCRHTATVTAIDRVDCRVVEDPDEYLAAHPEVTLYICRILARRLDSLNRYLVDIKTQFADRADHLGMVDEVLGAIMNRQPRDIAPPPNPGP
jgi:CRP/FNR family cyclic AMP-dependent transcriptional regulator